MPLQWYEDTSQADSLSIVGASLVRALPRSLRVKWLFPGYFVQQERWQVGDGDTLLRHIVALAYRDRLVA